MLIHIIHLFLATDLFLIAFRHNWLHVYARQACWMFPKAIRIFDNTKNQHRFIHCETNGIRNWAKALKAPCVDWYFHPEQLYCTRTVSISTFSSAILRDVHHKMLSYTSVLNGINFGYRRSRCACLDTWLTHPVLIASAQKWHLPLKDLIRCNIDIFLWYWH